MEMRSPECFGGDCWMAKLVTVSDCSFGVVGNRTNS